MTDAWTLVNIATISGTYDDFNYSGVPDPTKWTAFGGKPLGTVNGTDLIIDDSPSGREAVETRRFFKFGTFVAKIKLSGNPSVGGPSFQLYKTNSHKAVVAFQSSGLVSFAVQSPYGTQVSGNINIGLLTIYHDYEIRWLEDRVEFWVDSVLKFTATVADPDEKALVIDYFNVWGTGLTMTVDYVTIDSEEIVVLDCPFLFDQGQTPRNTVVSTQGRDWDRVHHDGAGPLEVDINAVLLDDTPEDLEERVEILRRWARNGDLLILDAPGEVFYDGLTDLRLDRPNAPREIGRLTSRQVSLRLTRAKED